MSASDSDPHGRDAVELDVHARVDAGDLDGAASLAITHYGPELFAFLRATARDEDLAAEAFSSASEDLWRGLAKFRWEASLRTWAYQLARHALHRLRSSPARRLDRNLPLSVAPSVEAVKRSQTQPYQRTEIKDGMREIREALEPDDHELLILRLDRNMSWKDIARSLADLEDTTNLEQRAAALRKRFERVKTELKQLAIERGLIPGPD